MRKLLTLLLVICLAVSLLLAGCTNTDTTEATNTEEKQENKEAKEVEPILLTGSSTLGPVITQLTKDFMDQNKTWKNVDEELADTTIDIVVSGGGSGAGVKSVINGSSDFGMASRPVSNEEKSKIDGYKEYKLGTDALTLAVNPDNKIYEVKEDITTEELRKIFSGEYKYWDELDKSLEHEEIVLVTRDIGGGAHKVFQKKVMGDVEVSSNVIQAPSMGALVTKIIENKNAIGYASYGVVNQNEDKVVPLKVDGVAPTKENIISGDYKISRPLLVITDGDINPYEEALIKYIASDIGMKAVEEMGFVPEK